MKKIKIIALIGKAGSGKDFWLKQICKWVEDVHEIISCTTRPKRFGEIEDINYHYLSDEQFHSEHFLESCSFNGWYYGTRYSDLDPDKINIGVFNLNGVEILLGKPDIDLSVIHVIAADKIRLIRQLERDASNIEEIFRRYRTDESDFNPYRLEIIDKNCDLYLITNNTTNQNNDNESIFYDLMKIIQRVKNK